jgi:Trk K+ transport system NAD-binding subunit
VTGHVIVCGMGRVGYGITELLLRAGEQVTVITLTSRDEWIRSVEAQGARVIRGDARDEALLATAGLADARALIAASTDDPANIEIALDARQARPDLPVVIRMFDQHLAHHLESAFSLQRVLGVSALAAPALAAAALGEHWIGSFRVGSDGDFVIGRIVADARTPPPSGLESDHGLITLTRADGRVSLATPGEAAPFAAGERATVIGSRGAWERWSGAPRARTAHHRSRFRRWAHELNPLHLVDFARRAWKNAPLTLRAAFLLVNTVIALSVLVFRVALDLSLVDAFYFIITTVTTTGYGDITPRGASTAVKLYACLVMLLGSAGIAILYSIITDLIVTTRFQQLVGRRRIPECDHVVVAGLGNVGLRLVEELQRAGAGIVVIERSPEGEFLDAIRAKVPVVTGDARLPDILARAAVSRAHAIVAVIDDDVVSLGVALEARRLNPRIRTVVRMSDAAFARKVRAAFHVDDAMHTGRVASPAFVAAALEPDVLTAFVQGERLFAIVRRRGKDGWAGLTPARLRADRDVLVVLWRGSDAAVFSVPAADRALAADDDVIAVISRPLRPEA